MHTWSNTCLLAWRFGNNGIKPSRSRSNEDGGLAQRLLKKRSGNDSGKARKSAQNDSALAKKKENINNRIINKIIKERRTSFSGGHYLPKK